MNYGQFLNMVPEATLVAILIILFFADFALSNSEKKHPVLRCLTHTLLLLQLVACVFAQPVEVFGGLYVSTAAANAMKLILTGGSLIVAIMAQTWIEHNEVTRRYEGEFYMLLVSTLLGMYVMTSSGHFLMFFLGLEMASVPMACMVAMDKWKKDSAEAGAKYILTATFSSAIMLYGISFIYGACGTLYFNDVAATLSVTPLTIAGLVFFFAGLGFKLSLVPFHFWTADTYQGAPTTVTAYLSVISKGAAAFALCAILMKVFGAMTEQWEMMMYIVIVLTITIGNLFAMRQSELKRFMAFSSISQAGYIMLAVIGNSSMGVASLMFYTLVYVAANLAVFAVISVVEQNNGGTTERSALAGFYETNPRLSLLMTLALFSLAGIPPFAGMFSKFFVFMAAAQQGSFWAYFVVFIALINTVPSLYYYLLIVKEMYIKKTATPLPAFQSDSATKLALALCTVGIVLFGVCSCIYEWLNSVAAV
ncbi:MAG: NADH-quinone oxidoreductase subunit N [Prevotella sp.]|jgi:NADH-quinone oxidoreductase subunit N|nr:NADH-quinone oxidoreductase subunit N [Prevotella sp.]